ncbi:MAG: hypothetical protein EA393_07035 [Bacteroidetes bacterium]|nr:MAG: hypothetical protein EA393_07035 [Bacteroidota bacterium]
MYKLISIGLLFFLPLLCTGQEDAVLNIPQNSLSWFDTPTRTDSLKKLLAESQGREKVHLLCELSKELIRVKTPPDKYIRYLQEALELSEKLNYNTGKVMVFFIYSLHYKAENNDIKELQALKQAESFFDHETHWTLKHRIWYFTGLLYRSINQPDSAFFYHYLSLTRLDKDTAWFAHLRSHVLLMQHASLSNEHKQIRVQIENIYDLLQANMSYFSYAGFRFPEYYEELSINLANFGEYRRANTMMLALLKELNNLEKKSVYTEFMAAKILGRIARINSHWGRNDSALVYFDKSIRYFDKVYNDHKESLHQLHTPPSYRVFAINAANQLEERAVVYIRTGELKKAEEDLLQSMQIRREYEDMLGEAMCCEKMGELYSMRGQFLEALNWYNTALNIKNEMLEQHKERARRDAKFLLFSNESYASTYLKIGRLYNDWSKPQLGVEYIRQSLFYSREAGFQRREAEALTTLGDIYLFMIQADSALVYYNTAKSIYENMEHKQGLAEIHESIGSFCSSQLAYTEAGKNYSVSQQLYEELEMLASLAGVLVKQGNILGSQGYLYQAIDKYSQGLEIGLKLNMPHLKMNAYSGLSEVFLVLGEIEESFLNYKKYHEMKDLLFTMESNRYLTEIETQYETEQNRQKLLLLESQNKLSQEREARSKMIILVMVGFIVIMLLWILLYLRHNRLKNGHERIQLQLKLFRSQMNPHFIFNSLGSIQSSILNEEPDKAVKYLSRFSRLMRNILDSSDNEKVTLSTELATIENYLELQKARFTKKFDYKITGKENLDADTIYIPPMLAQPFIENSIEHGIRYLEKKGFINVSFHLDDSVLFMEVEDNGIGRKRAGEIARLQDKDHQSMAIQITRRRIEVINKQSARDIRFEIKDLYDDKKTATGTKVTFEIPVS